jgi:hypothetical protein
MSTRLSAFVARRRLASAAALLALAPGLASAASLRFTNDQNADADLIQRVRIVIGESGAPADLHPAMDLGDPAVSANGSFTLELWLRGSAADNTNGSGCDLSGDGWIGCNIVVDRDVNGAGDAFGDFGLSVCADGGVRAGLSTASGGQGVCAAGAAVLDGDWHHLAWTRDGASGGLCLFVDGVQDDCRTGPSGAASYDDTRSDGSPSGQDATLVLAAEKHGFVHPGFTGWLDEARFSRGLRYAACGDGNACFTRPAAPFASDADTLGLYHFDEGAPGSPCDCTGPLLPLSAAGSCVLDASANAQHAECRYGGPAGAQGPVYSAESPFAAPPAAPALSGRGALGLALALGACAALALRQAFPGRGSVG